MAKLVQEIKDLGIMFKIWGIATVIIFATLYIYEVYGDPPNSPVLSVGTITDTTIELSWTETSGNHGHTLFRCDTNPGCDPDEVISNNANSPFTDTNLEPEKLYRYKVEESHGPNSAISNTVEATTDSSSSSGGLCGGQTSGLGSPPKVDIFAEQVDSSSILVTWENPNDSQDCIIFIYTVYREVNKTDVFVPIFSSLREVEEKTINEETGQQIFYLLDEDIQPNTFYAYRISAGNSQGNPNPQLSDDTRPIFIDDFKDYSILQSNGHLILGRNITPVPPIIPIVSWFNWFSPPQIASAETLTNPIFTTSLNPQTESYILGLEPIPKPEVVSDCTESLEIEYTKNQEDGQDFNVVVSIFETEIQTDDETGVEIPQEIKLLRHQKTFENFTDSTKIRHKWQVIEPEFQKIHNYSELEVQLDITGKSGDPRSMSVWEVLFLVPNGVKAC